MEKNIDRKTLSFGKGMTNVPSDLLSGDDELVESDGFIYRDGEMKPIQKPIKIGNIPYKIMYVHKGADFENLIAVDFTAKEESGGGTDISEIYYYRNEEYSIEGEYMTLVTCKIFAISSCGNILILATEAGLNWAIYKNNKYVYLGGELPAPSISFYFKKPINSYVPTEETRTVCNLSNDIEWSENGSAWYDSEHKFIQTGEKPSNAVSSTKYYSYKIQMGSEHDISFRDTIQGHVSQAISWVKEKSMFAFPFFIRYALKLFDGTYARISNPIVCYPTINRNFYMSKGMYDSTNKYYFELATTGSNFFYFIEYKELLFSIRIPNIDDWKDIVKEVVVFASDDVVPFKIDGTYKFEEANVLKNSVRFNTLSGDYSEKKYIFGNASNGEYSIDAMMCIVPSYKTNDEIIDELVAKSQFYKLFSIDINSPYINDGSSHSTVTMSLGESGRIIKEGVIENLLTQERLKVDDYFGWSKVSSKKLFIYNGRINLTNAWREPFRGFSRFSANSNINYSFCIYTHIVSSSADFWVRTSPSADSEDSIAGWLFYPDPNAKEMIIYDYQSGVGTRISLKIHPLLNGAYSFNGLPRSGGNMKMSLIVPPSEYNNKVENFDSQIFTSVVNNPFVFEASGDNTVGTGRIIDIAANTEAVSQGQFGQYPLLVFTSEGIYGLSVNSEGLYSASYPISREVCNDDSPIIPTDKLIFFASKKGLMATSGGAVACMSEQMRGRIARNFSQFVGESFLKFLEGSVIAYDYRDSLLRIFKPGQTHHYIYNMVDKTFAMVNDGIDVKAAVNNYPDNLIQDKDGNVYSLVGKPDINDDENVYSGSFVTRPLKLGGSLSLKSLRAIKNLVDSDNGSVKLEIWGSNDCRHWQKLSSIYGKPWKYFTFKYNVSDFKATDSFAGSVVEIQTRREDKMR